MNITKITLYGIELPLRVPFIVSYETYYTMKSIIAKVETDEGIVGYGEAVPDAHVTGETWKSAFAMLQYTLAPALIGKNPLNIAAIHETMDTSVYRSGAAKAALDIACYDILGKACGQPVYTLLGGRVHEKFPITHVLSIGEPEAMAQEAEEMIEKGYTSFKMKVGRNVTADLERIRAVRERIGTAYAIRVDVNQGWVNASNTIPHLHKLEELQIDWLEQPIAAPDIDGMSDIRKVTRIPLMIDEGVCFQRDMRDVIVKKAAHKVNIKLMKCGGIYRATQLIKQAELAGLECQIGSMLESSVSSSAGFHVAFAHTAVKSVELTGPLRFTKEIGNLHYDVPYISLNEQKGLGVNVNEEALQQLTSMKAVID